MASDFREADRTSISEGTITSMGKAEMSEFINLCSIEVWEQVRDQLRTECASNRVGLKDYLELSARRKAYQLSRSQVSLFP